MNNIDGHSGRVITWCFTVGCRRDNDHVASVSADLESRNVVPPKVDSKSFHELFLINHTYSLHCIKPTLHLFR